MRVYFKTAILLSVFIGALFFVSFYNIYEQSTSPASFINLIYHIFRVIIYLYIVASFVVIGYVFIEKVLKIRTTNFLNLERIAIYFFIGSSILRILIFFLGYVLPYSNFLFLSLLLPQMIYGALHFEQFGVFIRHTWSSVARTQTSKFSTIVFVFFIVVIFLGIYVKQCLYTGDGDYLTHYLPYHLYVLEGNGLMPNEVWYHFFYSKGAGLVFLSMRLIDNYAVVLVSFSFIIFSMILCSCLIYRATRNYVASLIYFTSLALCFLNTADGFFVKHHAEIGGNILFLTVFLTLNRKNFTLPWKKYLVLCMVVSSGLALYSPPMSVYAYVFIGSLLFFSIVMRDIKKIKFYILLMSLFTASIIVVFTINYYFTGLFEITPFRVFLKYYNESTFSKWVSPYLLTYLSQGSGVDMGTVSFSMKDDVLNLYSSVLRVKELFCFIVYDKLFIFFAILSTLLCFLYAQKKSNYKSQNVIKRIFVFCIVPPAVMIFFISLSLFFVNQRVSLYRSTEFMTYYSSLAIFGFLFIFTIFSFDLFKILLSKFKCLSSGLRCNLFQVNFAYAALTFVMLCCFVLFSYRASIVDIRSTRKVQFLFGTDNLAQALSADFKMPVSLANFRKEIIGSGRAASFNLSTRFGELYYHYPSVATEVSYAFGNNWHRLAFDDPESAQKYLKDLGINYFIIDTTVPVFGCLPFSKLFKWDTLDKYFRICYEDDGIYILTWKGGCASNVSNFFKYTWKRILEKRDFNKPLFDRVEFIYNYNLRSTHNIKIPDDLPPVEGWQ